MPNVGESNAAVYSLKVNLSRNLYEQLRERSIRGREPMAAIARHAIRTHLERCRSEQVAADLARARSTGLLRRPPKAEPERG